MAAKDAMGPSIRRVEMAMREWMEGAEVAQLEQVLRSDNADGIDVPEGFFAHFGKDLPEHRKLGPVLREAVETAKGKGQWIEAAPVFCDEMASQPDYDVPYIWLAEFMKRCNETKTGVALLKYAAMRCRRKSILPGDAAEYMLFAGEVRDSVHLFAQAIAAMPGPPQPGQFEKQRILLCMAELFDVFEDPAGWRWMRWQIQETELEEDYARSFRDRAFQMTSRERDQILREVSIISRHVRRLFPRRRSSHAMDVIRIGTWLRDRREQHHRRLLVKGWAERVAAKHDANPPLPRPYETIAERVAELVVADDRLYLGMTEKQRKRWHDRQYLDQLVSSGEQPEESLQAIVGLRAIGKRLNQEGGYELMVSVAERADVLGDTTILRKIEMCWDGIGAWMA